MNIRLGRGRSLLAVFAALCFAVQGDTRLLGQEKEKNSLESNEECYPFTKLTFEFPHLSLRIRCPSNSPAIAARR